MTDIPEVEPSEDVEERQQTDEQLWQCLSSAIIDALPEALLITNEKGIIVRTNWQCEMLFGYARTELYGNTVEMLVPERFREQHKTYRGHYGVEPYPRKMSSGMQLIGRRKDGTDVEVHISLTPVMTERGLYTVVLIHKTRKPQEVHNGGASTK